ncbi:hypothetical protein F5X99DRAFT_416285 [Biscogniauxia marginata]|nr:hypothetical protein F5X99DRAFT_416285 [Biscogniauxia marginata]
MNNTTDALLGRVASTGYHNPLDPTPFYPTLGERVPIGYVHRTLPFVVSIAAHYMGHGTLSTAVAGSLLVLFMLQRPFYTTGGNFGDYAYTALDLWLITRLVDFYFNPPRYLGGPDSPLRKTGGVHAKDLKSWKERLVWALRLQFTPRGVGWDWEVKGIVENNDAKLSRSSFVAKRAVCFVYHLLMQDFAIYMLEIFWTIQPSITSPLASLAVKIGIAWGGGMTLYQGFGVWDNGVSALTVLIGLCQPWEWPPILGTLESAWSVRQWWGESYHQMLRRTFQTPGLRVLSFLGLKKGTLASRYLQLYIAFALSSVLHLWGRFSFERKESGEIRFFMSQAVLITIEDTIQWLWARMVGPVQNRSRGLRIFELYTSSTKYI